MNWLIQIDSSIRIILKILELDAILHTKWIIADAETICRAFLSNLISKYWNL